MRCRRGVAVPERLTRGGTGSEHEVRTIDPSSGGTVDDDGFDLVAVGVDEHHAALVGREPAVAPRGEDDDHGA